MVSWMPVTHRIGMGVILAALMPVPRAGAQEPTPQRLVLPPGQEDLFRQMLSPGETRCTLQDIQVAPEEVRGTYRCPTGTVEAHLRPRETEDGGLVFDVTVPEDLPDLGGVLRASAQRLAGQVKMLRPAPREPEPPPPETPEAPSPEFHPEEQARYHQAEEWVKEGRCPEALTLLEAMARERPVSQTLGLMVVCLAADALDPARVQEEVHRAETDPDDPLAAFRAGVISHYAGHRLATTRAEKAAFYREAIRFLERTLPACDQVTRVHLYLAVSHYRLGHQEAAEQAIARAVALAERTRDADAWYCRAEIRHRKDLAGALRDIETYFGVMAPNIAQGAIHSPTKQRRVQEMQRRLQKALSGEAPLGPDEELFDPLPNPVLAWVGRHGRALVWVGMLVGLLAFGVLASLRRRSRARQRHP